MKKYYAGRKQSNGEYVYVIGVIPGAVQTTNIVENALAFKTEDYATYLADIANAIAPEEEYGVLEIETTIKEL